MFALLPAPVDSASGLLTLCLRLAREVSVPYASAMTIDPTPCGTVERKWTYATLNLRVVAADRLQIPEEKCGWAEIATLLRQTEDKDLLRYRGLGKVSLAKLRKDLHAPYLDTIHGREICVKRKGRRVLVRVRPTEGAPEGCERWIVDVPAGQAIDDVIR